jgi:hypothetical protein
MTSYYVLKTLKTIRYGLDSSSKCDDCFYAFFFFGFLGGGDSTTPFVLSVVPSADFWVFFSEYFNSSYEFVIPV